MAPFVVELWHVVFECVQRRLGAHLRVVQLVEFDADAGDKVLQSLIQPIDACEHGCHVDSDSSPLVSK